MLAFRSLDPFRALREPDRRRRDEERLSRSEQRTLSKTQNNHLTGKAPYKFERGILHLMSPERRMLHWQIHLPVAQLRVTLHPVFGALYGHGANTSRLTALRQLVLPQCHAPRFDVLVQ